MQISFAVTAKLISAFVFAIWIEQSLYYLNPKLQASSYLLWLYSPVCVGPGRNPEDRFSQNEALMATVLRRQAPLLGPEQKSLEYKRYEIDPHVQTISSRNLITKLSYGHSLPVISGGGAFIY